MEGWRNFLLEQDVKYQGILKLSLPPEILSEVEVMQAMLPEEAIRLDKDDAARLKSGELNACEWGLYNKPTGFVTVPVHKTYGAHVVKRLQNVVDAIFVKGIPPLSLVA